MKRECGFTLIELMVVVAIVAVLSAIAIPMYMNNVGKSKVQEAVDTIGAIKDEMSTYVSKQKPRANPGYPWCSSAGEREVALSRQKQRRNLRQGSGLLGSRPQVGMDSVYPSVRSCRTSDHQLAMAMRPQKD